MYKTLLATALVAQCFNAHKSDDDDDYKKKFYDEKNHSEESRNDLRIGVFSDLHLNLRYDRYFDRRPNRLGDCWPTSGEMSDVSAPLGRYFCDPPMELIDVMLDEFVKAHGEQDVIFLTGDYTGQHMALDPEEWFGEKADEGAEDTYPFLLAIHSKLVSILGDKFPRALIIPAFGNNDTMYHDNPIPLEDEYRFFAYIYTQWFDLLPGNRDQLYDQREDIKETFMKGGYYRVDINDRVSVLVLNSLFFAEERHPDWIDTGSRGADLFKWLEDQLSDDSNRKFIITSHIYPGIRYNAKEEQGEQLWDTENTETYFKLLEEYKDRVLIELGGHDHFTSLRTHESDSGGYFHNIAITAGISPRYSNNPGVTSFEITDDLVPH